MTRERYAYFEPFIEAWKIGRTVQYRVKTDCVDYWVDVADDLPMQLGVELRIKPKPRVWWAVLYDGDRYSPSLFVSEDQAIAHQKQSGCPITIIKVQEVL